MIQWITQSGHLVNANENQIFSFFLSFNMSPIGTVSIVSGKLPNGLTLDDTGAILGTVLPVDETFTYEFTVRLQNSEGIADRAFSITILNESPYWITPSIIEEIIPPSRDYRTRQVIDFDLEIHDPSSNGKPKFELISGRLPDGVTLRDDGKITGYIKDRGNDYIFSVRAHTKIPMENTFVLKITDDSENRPPFWSTLNGWLGDIRQGVFYNFELTGSDSDGDNISFQLRAGDSLPTGITLQSNGRLSGNLGQDGVFKHHFGILIKDGVREIEREFFLRCNFTVEDSDVWITNPIEENDQLGTLEVDEECSLKITAYNNTKWVRYELNSGTLPEGLSLNIVTGDIEGTVSSTNIGEYEFEVRVYNEALVEEFRTFKIEVIPNPSYRPYRVSTILTGDDRVNFNKYFHNYVIPYEDLYRPSDKNFGIKVGNELLIKKYVNFSSKQELYDVLKNKIGSTSHPSAFKYSPVLDSKSNVICEALYLDFEDDNRDVNFNNSTNTTNLDWIKKSLEEGLSAPVEGYANWHTGRYNTNIQGNNFYSENHNLYVGKEVYFKNQNLPSPFLNNTTYYALPIDKDNFRLSYSPELAQYGGYVYFNVNDVDRPGSFYTHHNGIPIAYVRTDRGRAITQRLNNEFSNTFNKIKLNVRFVVHGPTQSKIQEELEMMFFDADFWKR